jgi:hypothetical protein
MSLLRLLATGKSLVGMRDTESRYRMRTQNLLPKFGSAKNPFAPAPPNAQTPTSPANPPMPHLETGSLFDSPPKELPKQPVTKQAKTPPRRPADADVPVKAEVKLPATPIAPTPVRSPAPKPRRWSGWIGKFNPLALLPSKGGDGGRGRGARKPVQAELTLERVRVVRNDLRDTDFEIVPGRLMGLPSGASPILPHPERPENGAWNRLTSRFLGAQHAQIR